MTSFEKNKMRVLSVLAALGVLALSFSIFWNSSSFLGSLGSGVSSQSFNMSARDAGSPLSAAPMYESAPNENFTTESISDTKTVTKVVDKKIIKNGSLNILVNKTEDTIQKITELATRMEGFVEGSEVYKSTEDTKSGYVTVRVPVIKFEDAVREIKTFAEIVEREQVSAQDVTEDYVDMEARLKNLKAEEAQYLIILKKAITIKDILSVQNELGNVRENIERLQGQIQFLGRQTEMSTIIVNITSKADVTIFGIYWKPISVLKQAFHNLVVGLTEYIDSMISFLLSLPVLVLWFLTYAFFGFIGWKIINWIWTRFIKK